MIKSPHLWLSRYFVYGNFKKTESFYQRYIALLLNHIIIAASSFKSVQVNSGRHQLIVKSAVPATIDIRRFKNNFSPSVEDAEIINGNQSGTANK